MQQWRYDLQELESEYNNGAKYVTTTKEPFSGPFSKVGFRVNNLDREWDVDLGDMAPYIGVRYTFKELCDPADGQKTFETRYEPVSNFMYSTWLELELMFNAIAEGIYCGLRWPISGLKCSPGLTSSIDEYPTGAPIGHFEYN